MKRYTKYRTLSIAIMLVVMGVFLFFIYIRSTYPYPSIEKQRAQQSGKPRLSVTRLLDSAAIIKDLEFLASDSCEGRSPGSIGHQRSVEKIIARMREAGLDSFDNSLTQIFTGKKIKDTREGINIIGWVKGTKFSGKFIVISAHYDHMGKIGDRIYYGASDNASGTACLLGLAKYFQQYPQPYSLIFAAFDREETGLEGSMEFTDHLLPGIKRADIKLNLNLDMLTRNDKNEIFVCGIYHYPTFIKAVTEIRDKTNVKLLMGHDEGEGHDDWTTQSDHFSFHRKKIPFLYIGVEDHEDYHKPTDTFDKVDLGEYIENCNMIALLTRRLCQ